MNLMNTTFHVTKAGVVPPVNSTLTASFYFAPTLVSRYDHPIAYNTAEKRKRLVDILSFVEKLTIKLGREKDQAFTGMGENADYFDIRLAKSGGYSVRLCISIGEPREITFSATFFSGGSAVMVVDFMVATYAEALKAVMRLCTMTIDV